MNVPQGRDGRIQDPSVNTNISTNIHTIAPVDVNLTLLAGTCLIVAPAKTLIQFRSVGLLIPLAAKVCQPRK